MATPKVSVIVPAYNSGSTIEYCVESIISQSFFNLECIIVNDGSTDDTDFKCQELSSKHDNIKYVKTANYGVSHARNVGMDLADGDYFIFVDSDDYLLKDSIRMRVEKMSDNSLVICGYCEDSIDNCCVLNSNLTIDNMESFLLDLMYVRKYGYQGYIWNKVFSSKIIRDNGIRFNETIHYNEDRLFVFEYALKCDKVQYIHSCLYCYVQSDHGAMASVKQNIYDHKQITELTAFLVMLSLSSSIKLKCAICYSCFYCCLKVLNRIPRTAGWESDIKAIRSIKRKCVLYFCFFDWEISNVRHKLFMMKRMIV